MKKLSLLLPLLFIFACTNIDYIGESYEPTTHVDIFFDEADIEYDYKVMGQVNATASADFVDAEDMMEAIKKKAMEKGADAVLVLGLDKNIVSETTTYEGETKDEGDKVTESGKTTTSTSTQNEIKAMFLKYKMPKKKEVEEATE